MYSLKGANEFIKENKNKVNNQFRLKYHVMPSVGWMNDPNGVSYFNGLYHVFYQHYPYDSVWGPMHWGHTSSKDLIHWKDEPVALSPDQPMESGCFSGGAIVRDDQLFLMYTTHLEASDNEGVQVQTQSIAYSQDGINFEKYANNPVIDIKDLPEKTSKVDFRDPNPFYRNGSYYVLIGSKTDDGIGQLIVYQSKDLIHWTYLNTIGPHPMFGIMAECPDLFHLDGKDVILMSSINLDAQDNKYRNVNSCIYVVGEFNTGDGSFAIEYIDEIDTGHDFYAPQTLEDDQNRRIMFAWMEMWGKEYLTHQLKHHWVGAMTLPRELRLIENQLIQCPVMELEKIRCISQIEENLELSHANSKSWHIEQQSELFVKGKIDDELNLTFMNTEADFFSIKIKKGFIELDPSHCQLYPQERRRVYQPNVSSTFDLRIFIDTSSIELFAYEGTRTITTRIYFNQPDYVLTMKGNQCLIENFEYFKLMCVEGETSCQND